MFPAKGESEEKMLKTSKRCIAVLLVVVTIFSLTLTASAAQYSNPTPNSMIAQGWEPNKVTSNSVVFNVTNQTGVTIGSRCSAVNVVIGSSTVTGMIIPDTLYLRNKSTGVTKSVVWTGKLNTQINFPGFVFEPANGVYELWWTGTVIGNTPGNPLLGIQPSAALRSFSNIKLNIN